MKKLVMAALLVGLSVTAKPTYAQYVQYSGVTVSQPPKQALIEKKILNPQNNQFVDNLSIEQQTFLPDQDITFRVTVRNITQSELKNLSVTDTFPDLLNFVSTSFGRCDTPCKSINVNIDNLKVGESKGIEIKLKVKKINELPDTVVCQTNTAKVTVANMSDEATSSFCVAKQILGTTTQLPTTGPTQTLPMILLSGLFLLISLLIRRILILERR